jgi:hypothetical protein
MTSRPILSRLGWRSSPSPVHGHEVVTVELPGFDPVRLARWLHPEAQRAPATVAAARVTALQALLAPGDVAVVIGAAEGAEAIELGLAVGPTGAVVALEADRGLFPVLAANAALNRDRLRLLPHLLAVAHDGAAPPPFGVEAHPLEPFLRARHAGLVDRLRWLSLPFGAAGPSLLEALQPLLSAHRPLLRIQVERGARRPQRQALLAALDGLGYRVERFTTPVGERAAQPPTPAEVLRGKLLDLLALPSAPLHR